MNNSSDYDMSLLGTTIRERRQAAHLTQDQLAEAASVSSSFISRLERGHPGARYGKVVSVLKAVGLDVADVTGLDYVVGDRTTIATDEGATKHKGIIKRSVTA